MRRVSHPDNKPDIATKAGRTSYELLIDALVHGNVIGVISNEEVMNITRRMRTWKRNHTRFADDEQSE
jgi:hypothetical protein